MKRASPLHNLEFMLQCTKGQANLLQRTIRFSKTCPVLEKLSKNQSVPRERGRPAGVGVDMSLLPARPRPAGSLP